MIKHIAIRSICDLKVGDKVIGFPMQKGCVFVERGAEMTVSGQEALKAYKEGKRITDGRAVWQMTKDGVQFIIGRVGNIDELAINLERQPMPKYPDFTKDNWEVL